MTDAKRTAGGRDTRTAAAMVVAGLAWAGMVAFPSVARGGLRDFGCCPGCMNGGARGLDGEIVTGVAADFSSAVPQADVSPSVALRPGGSRRDRSFDLYARPPGGLAADSSAPATGSVATSANAVPPTSTRSAAATVEASPPMPAAGAAGTLAVDFAQLASFAYVPPRAGDEPMTGVPPTLRALDGRRVRLSGYMLPFEMEGGRCRQFLILRSQMACCYGTAPQPTEWVVATSAKGVLARQDEPLSFAGTLRVGANFDHGVFTGVYRLEVDDEPTR